MDVESSSNWRLWCRLCTKDNATNITNILRKTQISVNDIENNHSDKGCGNQATNELVAAIEKYFPVKLRDDEKLPKSLCAECFTFVKALLFFVDRVAKAQEFFLFVQQTQDIQQHDSKALRLKYGLTGEVLTSMPSQLPEELFIDIKPEISDVHNNEDKILEPETLMVDPLEVSKVRLRIKLENTEIDKADDNTEDSVQKITGTSNNDENEINRSSQNEERVERSVRKIKLCKKRKGKASTEFSKIKTTPTLKNRRCYSSNDSNVSNEQTAKSTAEEEEETEKGSCKEAESNKTQQLLSCDECAMSFKRSTEYQNHMKKVHDKEVPNTFTCPHCSLVFKQYYRLRKHMIFHKPVETRRVVPCPYCDKKFTSTNYVDIHINYIHKDVRPFICEQCGERYHTNAQLRCHIFTHTDYAPFQCEVCQKSFKKKGTLKIHMQIHEVVKPICTECGLQLNTPSTLKRHMLVHSSDMQHKCDFCGRAFKRSKTLKNHLLLHTGLKPYTCNFCDRTFATGSHCRTHKKTAHPEELAVLEATGGTKTNTLNIPKLKALKALNKNGENLLPLISKQSGSSYDKSNITKISGVVLI